MRRRNATDDDMIRIICKQMPSQNIQDEDIIVMVHKGRNTHINITHTHIHTTTVCMDACTHRHF